MKFITVLNMVINLNFVFAQDNFQIRFESSRGHNANGIRLVIRPANQQWENSLSPLSLELLHDGQQQESSIQTSHTSRGAPSHEVPRPAIPIGANKAQPNRGTSSFHIVGRALSANVPRHSSPTHIFEPSFEGSIPVSSVHILNAGQRPTVHHQQNPSTVQILNRISSANGMQPASSLHTLRRGSVVLHAQPTTSAHVLGTGSTVNGAQLSSQPKSIGTPIDVVHPTTLVQAIMRGLGIRQSVPNPRPKPLPPNPPARQQSSFNNIPLHLLDIDPEQMALFNLHSSSTNNAPSPIPSTRHARANTQASGIVHNRGISLHSSGVVQNRGTNLHNTAAVPNNSINIHRRVVHHTQNSSLGQFGVTVSPPNSTLPPPESLKPPVECPDFLCPPLLVAEACQMQAFYYMNGKPCEGCAYDFCSNKNFELEGCPPIMCDGDPIPQGCAKTAYFYTKNMAYCKGCEENICVGKTAAKAAATTAGGGANATVLNMTLSANQSSSNVSMNMTQMSLNHMQQQYMLQQQYMMMLQQNMLRHRMMMQNQRLRHQQMLSRNTVRPNNMMTGGNENFSGRRQDVQFNSPNHVWPRQDQWSNNNNVPQNSWPQSFQHSRPVTQWNGPWFRRQW